MPLLAVRGVQKAYGSIPVLKGVSFAIEDGASFAVIGPNGAGKTTLLKVVTGEVATDVGEIRFAGNDVTAEPAHRRVRAGIGRTFQVARVFADSTVLENAVMAVEARMRNRGQKLGALQDIRPTAPVREEAEARLQDMGLEGKRHLPAGFLAHGDKKRLELALALALEPRLLVMDEPTAGMSPPERRRTVELVAALRQARGLTLLLTEHDMGVIYELADRLLVLNYGAAIAEGTPAEVRENQLVRDVYLGREMVHAQGH
jgi:branched-chain amino acid transport system ATP-binding protein